MNCLFLEKILQKENFLDVNLIKGSCHFSYSFNLIVADETSDQMIKWKHPLIFSVFSNRLYNRIVFLCFYHISIHHEKESVHFLKMNKCCEIIFPYMMIISKGIIAGVHTRKAYCNKSCSADCSSSVQSVADVLTGAIWSLWRWNITDAYESSSHTL